MVKSDLLASVAALSEAERIELVGFIESTLGAPVVPTADQQQLVERRLSEMQADPARGMSKDEALAATRALLA